jgi:hypothetical protein
MVRANLLALFAFVGAMYFADFDRQIIDASELQSMYGGFCSNAYVNDAIFGADECQLPCCIDFSIASLGDDDPEATAKEWLPAPCDPTDPFCGVYFLWVGFCD